MPWCPPRKVSPRARAACAGRFGESIGDALSELLGFLLGIVLCVLVLPETSFPTRTGIDPRNLWSPTDFERTLAWNLEQAVQDIAIPSIHIVLAASITNSSQPLSSQIPQENDFVVPDWPRRLEQASRIEHAFSPQQHDSAGSTQEERPLLEPSLESKEKTSSPALAPRGSSRLRNLKL